MTSVPKPLVAVIALMAAVFASLFLAAGPSSAAGYHGTGGHTISVNPNTPTCGKSVTVTGSHFKKNAPVVIKVNGVTEATTRSDGNGDFSTTFTFVCQGSGPQTMTVNGVDSLTIHALSNGPGKGADDISHGTNSSGNTATNGTGRGGNDGSGGLSSTGVAVVGIGAVGVVLLLGGGLLLFAGRRRRVSA